MEMEKRKREDDGGDDDKRAKVKEEDDGVKAAEAVPDDQEVEEFFAILKRIHVAVKYFQERNGGRCTELELTAAPPCSLKFEREDFEGVKKEFDESSEGNQSVGLDLNSDPVCDVSDHAN